MSHSTKQMQGKPLPWMHYQHYWKLIISVTAFSILCILLLSVFSYAMFTRTTMNEYSRIGEIEVARMNETFASVIEEASSLAFQLLSNKDAVSTCLFASEIDYLARYHAVRLLKTALASNRYLTNISLINLTSQSFLHPNTVSGVDVDEIIRINRESGSGFMRVFSYNMSTPQGASDQLLLSINPRSSSSTTADNHAAIIMWIDANRLLNRMLHKDDHDSAIALTNGAAVFARTSTLGGISEADLLNSVRVGVDTQDESAELSIQGNAYLVFSQPVDMIGWRLVYMYRVNQVPARSQRILLTGLVGVALFGLAVLIAILYVRRIYQPISDLMERLPDKYKEGTERKDEFSTLFAYYEEMTNANTNLSATMQNLSGFVKRSYLYQLLQFDQKGGDEVRPIQEMLATEIQFARCAVALIDVWSCDESEFASRPMLPQTVIVDEITSHIPAENVVEILVREDDRCILIVGLSDAFSREDLVVRCDEIARRHTGDDPLELFVCVGEQANGYQNIGKSHKSALMMASDGFLLGNGRAISKVAAHNPMPDEASCQQFTQTLIAEIKAASLPDLRGALDGLRVLLNGCTKEDAIETIQRVVRMVASRLDKHMSTEQREIIGAYIRHVDEQHCLDDVIQRLGYFFYDCANAMNNKVLIEQYELIEYAKKYAQNNYANCNLHIDELAKELNMSPVALGNLFKHNTGVAFYRYVNDVRLKQAERLLLETDMTVIEISHSVGILNYTYFFTLFKKKHHVSPRIFRDNKVT